MRFESVTTSMTLRQIHPEARRMVSHNRKWVYVYHIEASFVIVDRIIPAKMNKGWMLTIRHEFRKAIVNKQSISGI